VLNDRHGCHIRPSSHTSACRGSVGARPARSGHQNSHGGTMVAEPPAPLHQPPPVPDSLPPSPFWPKVFSSAERLLLCCSRSPQDPAEESPLPELSSALPRAPPALVVGLGNEGGWQHVGFGRHSARAIAPPTSRVEALERSLAFKRWARGRCFRCLEHGHQVGTCRGPFSCIHCRRSGHHE
jgi:hypothetical protein